MKVSPDFTYLITGSEDNVIFFSKIREFLDGIDVTMSDVIHNAKKTSNNNNN